MSSLLYSRTDPRPNTRVPVLPTLVLFVQDCGLPSESLPSPSKKEFLHLFPHTTVPLWLGFPIPVLSSRPYNDGKISVPLTLGRVLCVHDHPLGPETDD